MRDLYDQIMAWADETWGWIMIGIILTIPVIIIGFFLNWIGMGGFNFFIAFIIIPILFGLMFAPNITANLLAGAIASGISQQPQTVRSEIIAFLKTYLNFVKGLILGFLLLFTFLGAIPVSENPIGFFVLAVVIPAIILSASFWKFSGTWGKKLTYWGLIVITVISFGRFVPDDVYNQIVGFSPFSIFRRSETQQVLEKVEKQLEENKDKNQAEKLEEILEKIEDGKVLSKNEQAELDRIQKEVGEKSLPTQTKKIGGAMVKKTVDIVEKFYQPPANFNEKKSAGAKLIEPVEVLTVNGTGFFKQTVYQMLEGTYRLDFKPARAAEEASVRVLISGADKKEDRKLSRNCISIEKGEVGYAIGTKVPAVVSIYKI